MSDYDITEQSAGAADTDYVLGADVTEWATGQRLQELKAAEKERDVLRAEVGALRDVARDLEHELRIAVSYVHRFPQTIGTGIWLEAARKALAAHAALAQSIKAGERWAAMLDAQPMQIEVLVKERAALNAVQEAIVDILASVEPHTLDCGCCVRLPVSMFEAAGKAFAALAQPSKAGERVKAMERVCVAVRSMRVKCAKENQHICTCYTTEEAEAQEVDAALAALDQVVDRAE